VILGVKGDPIFSTQTSDVLFLDWSNQGGSTPGVGNVGVGANPEITGDTPTSLTLDWKLLLINEHRTIVITPPANSEELRIEGGVLTNWTVKYATSTTYSSTKVIVAPDWKAPYSFMSIVPRDAWLENYFSIN
jgi:hypothetical protein